MAQLEESKDLIKILLTTGIIGTDWPKKTYLIAVGKNRRGEVIWKKKYQTLPQQCGFLPNENHTERQMLDDQEFNDCLKRGEVEEIILTSNYSPCKNCAKDLIEFYKENIKLKLTIRFSHPYETRKENHLEGLKDLDRAGITLEAMTEKSWLEVMMNERYCFEMVLKPIITFDNVLITFDLDPHRVRQRDIATREKLKKLLRSDSAAELGLVGKMANLNVH